MYSRPMPDRSHPVPSVAELLGPSGPFAELVPGWESRPSQTAMASAVADAFQSGEHLVVEAPTGVGKTLAYLLPSALAGRRVIISTHTKNLQDQLIDKDLPRLGDALNTMEHRASVRFAVMKGRSNYLCLDRLYRRTRQRSLALFDADEDGGSVSEADLVHEIEVWARASSTGDRAELPGLPERSPLWDSLDARSEVCHGSRCQHHAQCFVTQMREGGQEAEVVIVNHHLLLADLALKAQAELAGGSRFGQVLPEAELLVLDEAHTIEGIAAEHFGGSLGSAKVQRLVKDVTDLAAEQINLRDPSGILTGAARVTSTVSDVFLELPDGDGRAPLTGQGLREVRLRAAGSRAAEALETLSERLSDEATLEPKVDGLLRRAQDCAASLRFVLEGEDPDYVYWSEGRGAKGRLGASPVDVARLLDRFLFSRFDSVVATSATLSVGDEDCTYFRRSVGVPETGSRTLRLSSAFDHAEQAALVVPEDAPEPGAPDGEARMAALAEAAIEAVGGGALFLCTSHRGMRAMYRRLAPRLAYPCLMQGDQPKRVLIAEFMERAPAVLFATQSFWDGVDIPGSPLRLVLVDRLPFDVPTDPLVRARADRLEAQGKSAFVEDQLPRAILRLKQGFGRLIRTSEDRGAVVILDARVTRRGYGRRFLDALPPARRLTRIEELKAWWQGEAR